MINGFILAAHIVSIPGGSKVQGSLPKQPGVYCFAIPGDDQVKYLGRAKILGNRLLLYGYLFAFRYRRSGRKVNDETRKVIQAGQTIEIWIQTTSTWQAAKELETKLIKTLRPPWNTHGV